VSENQDKQDILVVDDTVANLQVIVAMLADCGYKVHPVQSGRMALKVMEISLPDLILLDVKMPEMDGYEVCRQLKAMERTKDIPILFISAMSDTLDKVKAFEVGGIDYITKPFEKKEVLARISVHLELNRQKKQLAAQKREIEQNYEKLNELQTLKDNLIHMIVHDMRSPLSGIYGYLQLLDIILDEQKSSPPKFRDYLKQAKASTEYLTKMVSSVLDINRMESGELILNLVETDLKPVISGIAESMEGNLGMRRIILDLPDEAFNITIDPDIIARVIQNLLYNAINHTANDSEINIGIIREMGNVHFYVRDNGPGISPEYHEKIFEKFCQVRTAGMRKGGSTGLGLTFCKMAVEAHGGRIWVESELGKGAAFHVVLH
jgi:signal transduction histidine kinase